MTSPDIRLITPEETIRVRWPVLRAGYPRETAVFPGDDLPETQHLGAFQDGRLVGVASLYSASFPAQPDLPDCWQLRGMASLPEVRGQGYGKALLESCIELVRGHGGRLLWCNARTEAVEFYRRRGFAIVGEEFDIPTVGPHFRMFLPIEPRRE